MGAGCVEDLDRQIAAHTRSEQEKWLKPIDQAVVNDQNNQVFLGYPIELKDLRSN